MHLRIIDETINYPYSITQLRVAFPNVSLPAELTDVSLVEWDMYVVTPTIMPNDYTKNITEGTPEWCILSKLDSNRCISKWNRL